MSLAQTCRNTTKGTICKLNGELNIQNIGNQNASSFSVKFFLSGDQTFDGNDILLGKITIEGLNTGGE